jgi:hypothetical protein
MKYFKIFKFHYYYIYKECCLKCAQKRKILQGKKFQSVIIYFLISLYADEIYF